ncbi:MAG: 1,5-anhydro-D-fructose reductase [Promethearchaeota archaeon]
MEPLKLGIVGFGIFAEKRLAPALTKGEGGARSVELVAIQKRSLAKAREKAEEYGVPAAYDSVEALLADPEVEAVFVATPNNLHEAHAVAAARAGKHVLVEKPMATNAAACRRMVDACKEAGTLLMVAHCLRFLESVKVAREAVQSGSLGEVRHARMDYSFRSSKSPRTWFRDKAVAGGGALFDVGVHCVDTLRHVLGDEVDSAFLRVSPPGLDLERQVADHASLSLSFRSGALATVAASFDAEYDTSLEVRGSEGALWTRTFTLVGRRATIHFKRDDETSTVEVVNSDMYAAELDAFARAVRAGGPSPVPGEEGLRNQLVLDAALRATGGPVEIPFLERTRGDPL